MASAAVAVPSGVEVAYLASTVGTPLAEAIADALEACPADPVEYVALRLLHGLNLKETTRRRDDEESGREAARAADSVKKVALRAAGAYIIQAAWRGVQERIRQRAAREAALSQAIEAAAAGFDYDAAVEEVTTALHTDHNIPQGAARTEAELSAEANAVAALIALRRTRDALAAVSRGAVRDLRQRRAAAVSPDVVTAVRCALILSAAAGAADAATPPVLPRASDLRPWSRLTLALAAGGLVARLSAAAAAPTAVARRAIVRVRRMQRGAKVRAEGRPAPPAHTQSAVGKLMGEVVAAVVAARGALDDYAVVLREAGRDAEPPDDEVDDDAVTDRTADAVVDSDEEVGAQLEEVERAEALAALAAAAAAAAAAGEGEDE